MDEYPETLLPRQSYPVLSGDDVLNFYFVRETLEDIYDFLEQGYTEKDIVRKIFKPETPSRDVFELSVFLYGYYDEIHRGIRVDDASLNEYWTNELPDVKANSIVYKREKGFFLFLKAAKLHNQSVEFKDKQYILSFSHVPTRANYWHFQLWTQDKSTNKRITRELAGLSSAEKKHIDNLAKHILSKYVIRAIFLSSDAKRFQPCDFDKVINQAS